MPTPFTHLETAQRLLVDDRLPADLRTALHAECPAFLMGSIAADARTSAAIRREDTHFYVYDFPSKTPAWKTMLLKYPSLQPAHNPAHRTFLAGYVGHLAIDEIWSQQMLGPHFTDRQWGDWMQRFVMLHVLLIYMDERDAAQLQPWQPDMLLAAKPEGWTPFLSDTVLADWRDFIGQQIQPGGVRLTLEVMGARIGRMPEQMREILDSPETMQRDLWSHVKHDILAKVESAMYDYALEQIGIYWSESG